MAKSQKVLWSEGLFLTPHHFQQWDRYYEELLEFRIRSFTTFVWGVEELEFQEEALANGMCELLRCKAVLPDGLVVNVPDMDAPPPGRNFTEHFPSSSDRLGVYLGIPVARLGSANLASGNGAADSMARYFTATATLPDQNTGENPQPLALAAKNLRLLFGEDSLDNHVALKVAELRRAPDATVLLDELFIPPALSLSAAKPLTDILRRLYEILSTKSSTLAEKRRHRGPGLADFTTSDVREFWLLHTINSYIPQMMHLHHVRRVHPEQLYLAMARLAAELMTFVTEGHPNELPKYMHNDLTKTFTELDRKLRVLLEIVIPTRCVPIPLERTRESLHVGRILDDRLFSHGEFFLAVNAQMTETQLIELVPLRSKIASLDTISYLLGQALPGVLLRAVPIPPGPIPPRMGFKYFRLEKIGPYWDAISSSRNICIFFPAEFRELRLELYAVKE